MAIITTVFHQNGKMVHVIDNSSQLEVTLNNNKTYTAQLVGTDPKTDIALIKVEPDCGGGIKDYEETIAISMDIEKMRSAR